MFYKEYIKMQCLSIHKIGSNSCQEGVDLSKAPVIIDDLIGEILKGYFLTPFKMEEYYKLWHSSNLSLNEVYCFVSKIFEEPNNFHEQSINLAKHLYEQSGHPNIKRGEFYTAYFKDCIVEGETVDAIGLFKSENKDTFIRINQCGTTFSVESENGININKLDKGCLIFNLHAEKGYFVLIIDNSNRGEAKYWKEDFLHVHRLNDGYAQTQNALTLCKEFVCQLPEIDKANKALIINRVIEELKEEQINIDVLAENVFGSDIANNAFKSYSKEYQRTHDFQISDSFESKFSAIKRKSIGYMTTIKLDQNFEVNIRGGEKMIEKGYDEIRNLNYYKLYFEKEK